MKIRLVGGTELADRESNGWIERQIDMAELIVGFRNFIKVPKIVGQQYKVV
jgi:hypothetical protein